MMLVVVTYDVQTADRAGQKRLRQVAKTCENYGQRVQNSVFECWLNNEQFVRLRHELVGIIAPDLDSLRFYFLGANWTYKVEHIGAKPSVNPDDPLII